MIATLLLVTAGWFAPASSARAGTFVADLCQGPAGSPVGTAGLHEELLSAAPFVLGEDLCTTPGQQISMQLGPNGAGYMNLQGGEYLYETPSAVTISAYTLRISAYSASCAAAGHCPVGAGDVFVNHTGEVDPHYDFRDLGEGAAGPVTVAASGLRGVSEVTLAATCDNGCPLPAKIASFAVPQVQFTLDDSTVPKVTASSGPQVGVPIAGEAEWSFTASDEGGSGLYGAVVVVDGKTLGERIISEAGGLCKSLGIAGERVFASPQPCPVEASGATSVNTNDLSDGGHRVRAYVDTPAGESADVFDGNLTTANGPIVNELPGVAGTPQAGSTLEATNGIFALRAEQEWAGPIGGQWQRCVAQSSCQPIKGATATIYVPTPPDVGHALVYESIATAKVTDAAAAGLLHTTRADSVPTLPVSEAAGSGASCVGGCLNPGSGGNGGNGTGALAGTSAASSGGGGITVSVGGLGLPPAGNLGLLGSAARWQVSLKVSPRRVRRHTKIWLTGRVATSPRPAAGKLVYLQARNVSARSARVRGGWRKVPVYGRWITFVALRAKPSGAFRTSYRFRLGGHHTYQFRAVAPAEGQFRNPTGSSASVAVHER